MNTILITSTYYRGPFVHVRSNIEPQLRGATLKQALGGGLVPVKTEGHPVDRAIELLSI